MATEGMPARLILLRWVLVLATVYLVWFSNRSGPIPWVVPVYILAYLLSTPLVHAFVRRHAFDRRVLTGLVAFDVCWVSVGLLLVHREQVDFYPVVFLTLFIAAVALDLRGAVAAAVLLGSVHLATAAASLPGALWTRPEELLRLPFLLAAASFFGYLCQQQRRRARREHQLRRQRERLEALAAAAHDIRSPLANVVTLTEMVLEGDAGPLTEEQRDLIERAHADLWRVVRRATNLMDAARLDNQALPFEFETVDLAQVVEEVVGSMGSAARIRKVRLQLERVAEERPGQSRPGATRAGGEQSLGQRDQVLARSWRDSPPRFQSACWLGRRGSDRPRSRDPSGRACLAVSPVHTDARWPAALR